MWESKIQRRGPTEFNTFGYQAVFRLNQDLTNWRIRTNPPVSTSVIQHDRGSFIIIPLE